ncbi:MAG: hypothetical protein VKP62_02690 [Candidatus Sericytochromatia bacterium]|nr:hypothetical protein [Candidatus Sericytochromatia bacterium]
MATTPSKEDAIARLKEIIAKDRSETRREPMVPQPDFPAAS